MTAAEAVPKPATLRDFSPLRRRLALAGLWAAVPAAAIARTLHVAPGERLQAAIDGAADGDTIELGNGEHRAQTALIAERRLSLRAAESGQAVLRADGAHAEGKALIVVRGGDVRIEGLVFRGARVPHGNGAGIRFERGRLRLERCSFFDNEMSLLSANHPASTLEIDDCDFGEAPRHEGLLHHLLYVGTMASLELRGSRFSGGWRGHLVKSRARRNLIVGNWLVDGEGGEASYQIDLPNGGLAWVVGNAIGKSDKPQNQALLAYGAEGPAHAESALVVAHNTFVSESTAPAQAVRHWPERLPPGAEPMLRANLVFGDFAPGSWGSESDGNVRRTLADLDRSRWPRLLPLPEGPPLPALALPEPVRGVALAPPFEPSPQPGRRRPTRAERWRPGAFQD